MCPHCGKIYDGYPAISRDDNKTEICSDCGMKEAINSAQARALSPVARTKAKVYATGNKWAIENFNETHN